MTTRTVSRLYDDYDAAVQAVRELKTAGIAESAISIARSNADNWYSPRGSRTTTTSERIDRDRDGTDDRAEGAAAGAGIGAGVGGALGLLAGLGILAIPGIGPVVAAGWLASTAALATAGAAAGGLLGALTQAGVSEEDAHFYAEGVRRGGTLVTVQVADAERARVEALLDRSAVNTRERAAAYRETGWSRFDDKAPPYTAEQIRDERLRNSDRTMAGRPDRPRGAAVR